jgi:hypothetical protein
VKTLLRILIVAVSISAAAAGWAAPQLGGTDVTVRKQNGPVVYRGSTDARGMFATNRLAPGSYTLEVRSQNASSFRGSEVMIFVSGGRGSALTQSSVPGNKFGAGVAMNFVVTQSSPLEGQVYAGAMLPPRPGAVRLFHGKRYVWAPPQVGTQSGGRWIPEGASPHPDGNVVRMGPDWLRQQQDLGSGQRSR